ncbi:MAG: hypothetical protein AAFQ14_09540 [Cyanobacteria bacterium J06621_12]
MAIYRSYYLFSKSMIFARYSELIIKNRTKVIDMFKFIDLNKLTAKTLIGILMVGGLIAQSSNKQAAASNGVYGLELHYRDSAIQCDDDPIQGDVKVDIYNNNNDTFLTTMSKGERFLTTIVDSVNDLYLVYRVFDLDCLPDGGVRGVRGREIIDYGETEIPTIDGFNGQDSIEGMLDGLENYEQLYLVELGNYSGAGYDLQDVVMVVDNNPDSLIIPSPDDGNDNVPDPDPTPDGDMDNNGILDSNEIDSDIDNDGLKNFEDLDDDGDNIADVYELYTLSQISDTGTEVMTHKLPDGSEISVTLPNPPSVNIMPEDALNTDGEDEPDYQDTNTDNDKFLDSLEAGDTDLATAPFNSDSSVSGDNIADFRDLDSDDNGILDDNEVESDVDSNGTKNFQDLDDDGDGIIDLIEIGSDPASPTNSDSSDSPDYQDTDSDNDNILDSEEGVKDSADRTTAVSINYPDGTATTYNLQDSNLDDTKKDGLNCIAEDTASTCNMTSTSGTQGTVTVTGTMTGLDYQVPAPFAD